MPDTAEPVELIWTALSFAITCLTAYLCTQRWINWRAVRAAGTNGILREAARGARDIETVRLIGQGALLYIGAHALFIPPVLPICRATNSGEVVFVLFLFQGTFLANSLRSAYMMRRIANAHHDE